MRPLAFDPATTLTEGLVGAVVAEEVRLDGKRRFHKGHRLTEADLADLPRLERGVHLVRLEPDEVHEDKAGLRLARAAGGQGIDLRGPVQSRVNLVAVHRGLMRIDREAVIAINELPGMAIFTLPDRMAVLPGTVLAGAKITPVAIDAATLAAAEAIATGAAAAGRPVVQVKPFRRLTVGVVSTEGLADAAQDRFQAAVRQKVAWFGGEVLGFVDVRGDADRDGAVGFAAEIEAMVGRGADVILTGGGNTIDPLDPSLLALPLIAAEMVKFGAAAHPGSMFWLAYREDVPIFNLASCSLYSRATVADLVLPWVFAGERVTLRDLAELGVGGLLDKDAAFRFPPYGEDGGKEAKGKEVEGTEEIE